MSYNIQEFKINDSSAYLTGVNLDENRTSLQPSSCESVYDLVSKQEMFRKFYIAEHLFPLQKMNTNFFHNIIKDVKLTWNTILLEDIGQKFSVTYLYVNPNDSFFNGKLIVSQYTDDIHINHTVNIYDYGYVYNYKGLLNISFYAFNNAVKFDILMDCKNIIFDKPYYLGNDANNTNSSFTKQTYINDTLIEKILPKNIDYDFYKYKINKQYNYPCNIPEGFESNNTINYLKKCLLEAEVITYNDTIDYTYELAYLYKNLNTYETEWSNSIQIIRRQKNDRTQERLFSFTNIELLHDNVPGWIEMTIHNDTIRLYIDPTVLPDEIILFISNNTPSAVLQDSDNYYILETCFKKIPRSIIKHNFSRIVYNNYEQIFISRKFDDNNDFIIKFSKCMFNKLMTFQTIGLANAYEKIVNGDNFDVAYNMTSSDNIGPISINGGGWCGGNHSYLEEGQIKTAETISYKVFVDGKEILPDTNIDGNVVDIYVENNIYNPKVAPAEGDTILSSLLVKEYVLYRVINRTIYVHLTHHYMNETEVNVNNYYGFQSMFNHDYYIMTPDGLYTDFTKTTDVIKFNKTDYPDFNRFIETNNTKTIFQHVHLFDYKNGSHDLIDNLIFSYSSKKCYHKIIQNKNMSKGNVIEIAGTYCWFEPYVNDDYLLIYSSDINEYTYLYIDVKQAISNHRVRCPYNFIGRSYEIIDNKHNISISNDDNMMFFHLYLTSSEPGTLLLKFKSILI